MDNIHHITVAEAHAAYMHACDRVASSARVIADRALGGVLPSERDVEAYRVRVATMAACGAFQDELLNEAKG